MRRHLAALVLVLLTAACSAGRPPAPAASGPPPGVAHNGPAPQPAVCATANRHYGEWNQTAPHDPAEVLDATADEIAEFTIAADEFLRQTTGYPAGQAGWLTVPVGAYRHDLETVGAGVRAGARDPAAARAAVAAADQVRAGYRTFRAEAGCARPD